MKYAEPIVNTQAQTHVNNPTVNDVKEIAGGIAETYKQDEKKKYYITNQGESNIVFNAYEENYQGRPRPKEVVIKAGETVIVDAIFVSPSSSVSAINVDGQGVALILDFGGTVRQISTANSPGLESDLDNCLIYALTNVLRLAIIPN